ncbi:MAG: hydrolase [Actinomycetota bacterium]|nr:hydrolase [Actinomycetota bacterium]
MLICATCAVEYDEPTPGVCPICADDRQWVPAAGQQWTTLQELAAAGQRLKWQDNEPGLIGITSDPGVGIAQTTQLVSTPGGSLLWDPAGYVDDETAAGVLQLGPVLAIAASHPHMFGVQVEWSKRLGGAPILVCEADRQWLGRNDPAVEFWSDRKEITDGLTLLQTGGHFVGSSVAMWSAGAGGKGVLLAGDTIAPNPDRRSVAFMRSFPNRLPLSAAVVQRMAGKLEQLDFDRIYGNFNNTIDVDGKAALRTSADRHAGWVRGDFDHLS